MVDFTEETSRKNIIIKKVEYTIAQPFAEGHVCTANEANALNQLLSENVRNNFAPKVEKSEVAPTQEDLDNYVAGYQFGVRSVSSSDPVEKVMRQLVERKLIEALKARGKTNPASALKSSRMLSTQLLRKTVMFCMLRLKKLS